MDPLNDTLSRHGVLAADATSNPQTKRPTLTGPIWMLVKEGDRILVEGDGEVEDGKYTVALTEIRINRSPSSVNIKVKKRRDDDEWIYNRAVKDILTRNGKAFFPKQEDIDALIKDRPIWEGVQQGDLVRVKGSDTVSDGDYIVENTDGDLFNGAESNGISINDRYVVNSKIVGIVARGGKPYTGFGAVPAEAPAPAPQTEPLWKHLKVDDEIEINEFTGSNGGYSVARESGKYLVADFDRREPPTGDLRIRVKDRAGNNKGWIKEDRVIRINGASVGASPIVAPVRGNCLIHVDVPTILSNREKAEHKPVIVARSLSKIGSPEIFRELAWDGPSRFVHHEFVKIYGTDIQNWVETDATITGWRDGQGIIMLDPLTGAPVAAKPMTRLILGAFVIHVAAPVLMRNRREGRNDPVIAVRQAHSNWATDVVFGRRVEWSGPSRMVHRPSTPIPGTDGRGVSFIETDADITVYRDDAEPLVLRMPARAVAA